MHGWAREVIEAIGTPLTSPEAYLDVYHAEFAADVEAFLTGAS